MCIFDYNCTPLKLLKDCDGSNSGLTQIVKEEYPEAENEIEAIVNVVEFNKKLNPFLSQSNKFFKLNYPEKEHKIFLNAMIKNYKSLRKIKVNDKIELTPEKVIYSNEDWKFRTIASKLTNKCLIDDKKFPDWDNWSNIITDVGNHLNRKETSQLNRYIKNETKFLFTKTQFRNFVDFIPYMAFEYYFVCPCSIFTEHAYLPPFKVARPILYFK